MGRGLALAILLFLIGSAPGCAGPLSSPSSEWVKTQGGRIGGPTQERADRAFARVLDRGLRQRMTVSVLGSEAPAAFGWPDGQLFVTRGLVDLLEDDELAAAVAHEAGHLLSDGHLRTVAGLSGCREGVDAEADADAEGVRLLRAAGVAPRAMGRMLAKVEASPAVPASCRPPLRARVARLESRLLLERPIDRGSSRPSHTMVRTEYR